MDRVKLLLDCLTDGFFRLDVIEENSTAVCVLCEEKNLTKPKIYTQETASYQNFKNHIKAHHSEYLDRYLKVLKEANFKLKAQNEFLKKQAQFEQNLLNFITFGMRPLSLVECPYFKKIFEDLDSRLVVPSRRKLTRQIGEEYLGIKKTMKNLFKDVKFFSLASDLWSSRRRNFMGTVIHWLDSESLEQNYAVLSCRRFTGIHSYDRVASLLHENYSDYDIKTDSITAITTDGGSNFKKAFKVYKKKSSADKDITQPSFEVEVDEEVSCNERNEESADENEISSEDLNSECEEENRMFEDISKKFDKELKTKEIELPPQVYCAAHKLSLVAGKDFNSLISPNKKIKRKKVAKLNVQKNDEEKNEEICLLQKLHDSALEKCQYLWNASKWPKAAEIVKKILDVMVVCPCPTRWNSLFDGVSFIVRHKEKINLVFEEVCESKKDRKRKEKQIKLTDQEINYLEEYVTILKPVAVALDQLQGNIHFGVLLPTVIKVKKDLNNLSESNLKYLKEVVPQLLNCIDKRFPDVQNFSNEITKMSLLAACFHPQYKLEYFQKNNFDETKIKQICLEEMSKISDINYDCDNSDDWLLPKKMIRYDKNEILKTELENFFATEDKSLKILNKFKYIKLMFIKFNTSLPSSASVERLFSLGGCLLVPRRCQLSDEKFEQLIFLKNNINYKNYNSN